MKNSIISLVVWVFGFGLTWITGELLFTVLGTVGAVSFILARIVLSRGN